MFIKSLGALHDAVRRVLPPSLQEFVKFGIVGTIGFIIDFSIYGILSRALGWDTVYCLGLDGLRGTIPLSDIELCQAPQFPIVAANMVSVLAAVVSNFLLNKFWTFRDTRAGVMAQQGGAYLAMSVVAWATNQVLTGLFASRIAFLHLLFGDAVDIAAKILAIGVVLFLNFGGSKFLIFRRPSPAA